MRAVYAEDMQSGSIKSPAYARAVIPGGAGWSEFLAMGPISEAEYQAEILAARREAMVCTRRQARLALGEARCAVLDAAAQDIALPWALRDAIGSTSQWHRTAQEIDAFAWLLSLAPADIDALFELAASL